MTKIEKIGAYILLAWCILWGVYFSYLVFMMPDYGTGVLR